MGSRCPKRDWCVVTTYIPPIRQDEREYTITLLFRSAPGQEALRAV